MTFFIIMEAVSCFHCLVYSLHYYNVLWCNCILSGPSEKNEERLFNKPIVVTQPGVYPELFILRRSVVRWSIMRILHLALLSRLIWAILYKIQHNKISFREELTIEWTRPNLKHCFSKATAKTKFLTWTHLGWSLMFLSCNDRLEG